MIDAKELRIGNLLTHNQLGEFKIEGIQPWHVWGSIQPGMLYYSDCDSIPLTKEWLEKFGFLKHETTTCDYWSLSNEWHIAHYKEKTHPIYFGFYCNESNSTIDTVHDLQNLYYAITKKELTINESHG